ncbi:MAG: hypothetical protein EA368_01150 [Leptolyngbya sp. DLM2.Bin27]|nr:MAG: hypothetical protein EA368_01150 [Leptolyngbya sp. DLM2.Bin27]
MLLGELRFLKNVDDNNDVWAYKTWQIGAEENLNWSKGSETNADKANVGDLILLLQRPEHIQETRVTHLLEVISEKKEIVDSGPWGIVRRVRVIWVANFEPQFESFIPCESDILGWKRQRPQGTNVIEITNIKDGKVLNIWQSMAIFQRHVAGMLGLIE